MKAALRSKAQGGESGCSKPRTSGGTIPLSGNEDPDVTASPSRHFFFHVMLEVFTRERTSCECDTVLFERADDSFRLDAVRTKIDDDIDFLPQELSRKVSCRFLELCLRKRVKDGQSNTHGIPLCIAE